MGRKYVFLSPLTDSRQQNTSLALNGAAESLGTIREENNAVYKYVQFSGTTAVAVGDFVCYVVKGSDGQAQIVDKANTSLGAGVAQAIQPAGSVSFGWVQIKGLATLANAIGAGSDNQQMTTNGATAGTITVATAVTQQIVGTMYDAAGKKILLDCPY